MFAPEIAEIVAITGIYYNLAVLCSFCRHRGDAAFAAATAFFGAFKVAGGTSVTDNALSTVGSVNAVVRIII